MSESTNLRVVNEVFRMVELRMEMILKHQAKMGRDIDVDAAGWQATGELQDWWLKMPVEEYENPTEPSSKPSPVT